MKTENYQYINDKELIDFISKENFSDTSSLFIQVFTGVCEEKFISALITLLQKELPNSKILGSTTDGEIIDAKVTQRETVLSFSEFESTTVETFITDFVEDSFQTGLALIHQMNNLDEAKLLITFSQGLNINGEEYVQAINESAPQLPIAGGLASDNAKFVATYVFTEKGVIKEGAVGALFFGDSLFVNRHFNFSWEPIGRELIVTKSEKNRVYTIDNIAAIEVYTKYLGHRISDSLPATGIEFPLIIHKGKLVVARAVLSRHHDGSLSFAGNIAEGEKVQFAYGNIDSILEYAPVCSTHLSKSPVESIFIYSCMARKRLLGKDIELELAPLNDLAPIAGFFTNGEFFHNKGHGNELLNQTMTMVALSESPFINPPKISCVSLEADDSSYTVSALSHLISVTSSELQELNDKLESRVKEKTAQLRAMNDSLSDRLSIKSQKLEKQYEELHETQTRLIENEKFVSLGTLVAGVSHEINTPVGLSLTGITYLKNELKELKKSYESGSMTESQFNTYINDSTTMMQSIHTNLDKAASLVKSFKQVAVDQSSDEVREFNLHEYIDEILISLHNVTRFTKHKIVVDIDINISLKSKPGAISQIITNLVVNSFTHAFEDKEYEGTIKIEASRDIKELTLLFRDDGIGMSDEIKRQLFDPFFTTKRGSGGSGLGMNIIYNIVTHSLGGSIDVESSVGNGTCYKIKIPSGHI